jgi:hypothetical protein
MAGIEDVLQGPYEVLRLARFAEILMHGSYTFKYQGLLGKTGQAEADSGRANLLNASKELGTIHSGHAHVGYDDVHGGPLRDGEDLSPARKEAQGPVGSVSSQQTPQARKKVRFVVHKYYASQNLPPLCRLFIG